jgi:hypothetical protein
MHPRAAWQEPGGGGTRPALQVKLQCNSLATITFQGLSARCSRLWSFGNLILQSLRKIEFRSSLAPKNSCLLTPIWFPGKLASRAWPHSGGLWKRVRPGDGCSMTSWVSACYSSGVGILERYLLPRLAVDDHFMVLDEKIYDISRILWSGPSISATKHDASVMEFSIHTPPMKSFKGVSRELWSTPCGCLSLG